MPILQGLVDQIETARAPDDYTVDESAREVVFTSRAAIEGVIQRVATTRGIDREAAVQYLRCRDPDAPTWWALAEDVAPFACPNGIGLSAA